MHCAPITHPSSARASAFFDWFCVCLLIFRPGDFRARTATVRGRELGNRWPYQLPRTTEQHEEKCTDQGNISETGRGGVACRGRLREGGTNYITNYARVSRDSSQSISSQPPATHYQTSGEAGYSTTTCLRGTRSRPNRAHHASDGRTVLAGLPALLVAASRVTPFIACVIGISCARSCSVLCPIIDARSPRTQPAPIVTGS
eukprot:scaffold45368_cov63-Phaeocystis_antarctica.AAC.3